VFLTGVITRQLGGGRFAQSLAAAAMALAPGFLIFCSFYSMNPLEVLLWTACISLAIRILDQGEPRLWPLVGLLIGIGLLNKHTLIAYAVSLAVALLATPARRHILSKWLWLGILLAGVVVLPNVIWQVQHGLPSLEFYRNANVLKNVDNSPLEVFLSQVFVMNPLAFPVWMTGVCYFLFAKGGRPHRVFGLSYVILLATMMWAGSSRPDRMLAAYPILFAGGATVIARTAQRHSRWVLQSVVVVLLLTGGIAFAPIALPLLPPKALVGFAQAISPPRAEQGATAQLPQWFADRFGWEAMASSVAKAYRSLPEQEQRQTLLLVGNYGEAGALEFYGARYGLPPVISPHNSLYMWGLAEAGAETYVAIGLPEAQLREVFGEVEEAGLHTCRYCMDYENNLSIYVCRGARAPHGAWWPKLRWYGGTKKVAVRR
jgi:hypothetical protein